MNGKLGKKMAKIPVDTIVQEYLNDMQLRNLSPRTIKLYRHTLTRLLDYFRPGGDPEARIPLAKFTPEAVRAYVTERMSQDKVYEGHPLRPTEARPLSKATLHQQIRIFRSFGTWLAENQFPNPFKDLKLPKLPKTLIDILSDDEIKTLFSMYNPNTHFGARWQAILGFFLDTGVRVGELAGLRVEDIDLQNFRAKVMGKGAKERYVLFGNRTHRLLTRYFAIFRGESPSPNVFLTMEGEALELKAVQNIVSNARRKSGIARLHCHLLRHTFATTFLLSGGNAFELQALLGHESLEMTRRYTHLAQQLAKAGGSALEHRRPSPLDTLEKKGVRLGVPAGRGSRQRGQSGRFEAVPRAVMPAGGRRGSPRPAEPIDARFESE
ncbi:MAG: tyrosine-type recombinase/integrase [Anaerolineales bacterium]|nr:tyrosine-type recombinase/integrase [Anaerolineales bacterium]